MSMIKLEDFIHLFQYCFSCLWVFVNALKINGIRKSIVKCKKVFQHFLPRKMKYLRLYIDLELASWNPGQGTYWVETHISVTVGLRHICLKPMYFEMFNFKRSCYY